ncbi:MAG: hypothetical protein JNL42_08445, partial [Anaerolineae bacterium]|nr:hypothetical protein [Anaerolineae bacterium]
GAPELRVLETIPPELASARLRFLTSNNRSSVTTRVNNTFTLLVRAGNSQAIQGISQIDGGEIHLTYDPTKLTIDALSDITAGASLGTVLQSQRNNTTGTLDFAAGTLTLPVQGEFTLVTIRFRALASTGSGVTLIQASADPYRPTLLTLDGAAITLTPTPMSVKINP